METLLQDVRFSLRRLIKAPGFALIAILSLALGIGANTASFTLINSAFFRPFPIAEPERVVALSFTTKDGNLMALSYPAYKDFRDRNEVLSGLIANYFLPSLSLSLDGDNRRVSGYVVTGNYFDVLGVKAAVGRTFAPEEDRTKLTHPVILISYGCWQQRFGGDPGVAGREVILNNRKFKIIGVVPQGFRGLTLAYDPEIWIPMMMQPWATPGMDFVDNRQYSSLFAFGRLKPGVTMAAAQASLKLLAAQLGREHPDSEENKVVELTRPGFFIPAFRTGAIGLAAVLMAAVALVLLIACTNLASLLLARATERRKEIAVRLSLGASRGRLVRQLLTENTLLSLAGGGIGVLLAMWLLDLGAAYKPPMDISVAYDMNLDWRVLLFTLIVALCAGVLFGLAPALQATKLDLNSALKDTSSQSGYQRSRLRGGLVVAQIALSFLLLIAAGLVVRALQHVATLDLGFEPERRLMMSFDLSLQGYSEAQSAQFQKELLDRVHALPGVRSASYTNWAPLALMGYHSTDAAVDGQEPARGANIPLTLYAMVEARYFETIGTPLVAGREFTEQDRAGSEQVVVVNETFVRRFFPGLTPAEAIGKRYSRRSSEGRDFHRIVGVARDGKYWTIGESPATFVWFPIAQNPRRHVTLVAQTGGDPAQMIGAVRGAIKQMDANLPVADARTLTDHLGVALTPARGAAGVLGSFGLLALLLAGIGIYGVMTYSVAQRVREIGIRMALGAQARDVMALVVRQGMRLALIGLAIGLAGAVALTRLMASVLYGVSTTDAATFVVVTLLLALVVWIACYIPARRATKVDPIVALRCD